MKLLLKLETFDVDYFLGTTTFQHCQLLGISLNRNKFTIYIVNFIRAMQFSNNNIKINWLKIFKDYQWEIESAKMFCGWSHKQIILKVGSFPLFPPPPRRLSPPTQSCSCCYQCIHWIRPLRVSRQCTQFTNLKYFPRSWLLAEAS